MPQKKLKRIRLHLNIAQHDLDRFIKRFRGWRAAGNPVSVSVLLRRAELNQPASFQKAESILAQFDPGATPIQRNHFVQIQVG